MSVPIGIVAVSAEGAALCYRTICAEGEATHGRHGHPEVALHTIPLADYMRAIEEADWPAVAALMLRSATILREAGARVLVCPDNTVHEAWPWLEGEQPLPWLHIADAVCAAAAERGWHSLGVLGTRSLMEGPVYPGRAERFGIHCLTPPPPDRERVNAVIFDELVLGHTTPESRAYFESLCADFRGQGCDAVVLGCTEIPLLLGARAGGLPTLASTQLLARAALAYEA